APRSPAGGVSPPRKGAAGRYLCRGAARRPSATPHACGRAGSPGWPRREQHRLPTWRHHATLAAGWGSPEPLTRRAGRHVTSLPPAAAPSVRLDLEPPGGPRRRLEEDEGRDFLGHRVPLVLHRQDPLRRRAVPLRTRWIGRVGVALVPAGSHR